MSRRLALIVGNNEYNDSTLAKLVAPNEDANGLAQVLRDPEIGHFDEATVLINEPAYVVRRAIAQLYTKRKRDDLLLLYFSGHGVLNEHGYLYLATKDTEREFLSATAIPANFITDEMDRSHSRRQVLILDCCHSGAFDRGSKGAIKKNVGTATIFEGNGYGKVILTATDRTQYAWEGDKLIGEADNSVFSHYLIHGLRTGEADINADGWITLDDLYDYVYEKVVDITPKQTPSKWSYKQQGEIIIACNPQLTVEQSELPRDLQQAINSPFARIREGAVYELAQFLRGDDKKLGMLAKATLDLLTKDDNRRVSVAANEVLEDYLETQQLKEIEAKPKIVDTEVVETEKDLTEKGKVEYKHQNKETSRTESQKTTDFNVLTGTISIETLGHVPTPVLLKGVKLPAEATQVFSTAADNQTQVEVHLIYGENKKVTDNISLGKFILDGIPLSPRGVPQVKVQFLVDEELRLSVTAKDEATGNSKSMGTVDLSKIDPPPITDPVATPGEKESASDSRDPYEIFEEVFGGFGFSTGRRQRHGPRRGADLRYEMTLDFEEAVFGVEREIEVPHDETCKVCNGKGAEPGTSPIRCPECNGTGEVRRQTDFFINIGTCPRCQGRGEIITSPCQECQGKGRTIKTRHLNVKVPAGVDTGTQIRLSGEGESGTQGGPSGNLYVVIKVKTHPQFRREEDTIHLELVITPSQAAQGEKIEVPTLDGNELVTIPAGTQTGDSIRLRGRGVPRLRRDGTNTSRGDQIVTIKVTRE